jgi:hypothetical protein
MRREILRTRLAYQQQVPGSFTTVITDVQIKVATLEWLHAEKLASWAGWMGRVGRILWRWR